jgi:hypothetical protein
METITGMVKETYENTVAIILGENLKAIDDSTCKSIQEEKIQLVRVDTLKNNVFIVGSRSLIIYCKKGMKK